ncbi:hypothetical protein JCGZ_00389 [Jatropha curcas]|uniref:Uncharacterized protein n=1 Tax=Jatropha curcas TaxID=180498 RepID=A0A067JG42_JATCU|nr:GDSL esterase/lipase At3g48460 [Jatropha curcas]KDP22802.1 hypothetical protein JCGZ_00389 [Jatropha curcas]
MASLTFRPFKITLVLAQIFLNSNFGLAADTQTNPNSSIKKIYAFGDSFTDTGNTRPPSSGPGGFNHVSSPPYGSTFFLKPSGRYCDGRIVIDFVAEALSLPPLPPYLYLEGNKTDQGLNFAVSGSTAIEHEFFVKNNISSAFNLTSIQNQINCFNEFLEKKGCKGSVSSSSECSGLLEDSLIWFGETGANDYAISFPSSFSKDTIREHAVSSAITAIQALLSKGLKSIAVQGLPPIGCLTANLFVAPPNDKDDIGCGKNGNNQSNTHNVLYQEKLEELRKQFPNAIIVYLDYYKAYIDTVKNAESYGFKEKFMACCGSGNPPLNFTLPASCGTANTTSACANPNEYINWDGVHLTEAMNKVLANMFLNGTYSQPPFQSLLTGNNDGGSGAPGPASAAAVGPAAAAATASNPAAAPAVAPAP